MERRAKIVATLGPASSDPQSIKQLMRAGMDVARINFSHGTRERHAEVIQTLREIARELKRPITIMQDLSGPKIRTGEMEDGQVKIKQGETLTITAQKTLGTTEIISVTYPQLTKSVQTGGKILIDDGKLELEVVEIKDDQVITEVKVGGILKPRKGVNLPGTDLNLKAMTKKDLQDLKFGLDQDIDIIALSFVRSAADIGRLRQAITKFDCEKSKIPVIAKLEHPEAIENLHEIIHASDGVMVARGDLGIEMPPEEVPIVQKRIISMANKHLVYVITATQMLDSMVSNPRPTRAEASDVANAVLDGSDAVMLSGETAIGAYPVKTVDMMASIIRQGEQHMEEWGQSLLHVTEDFVRDDAVAITRAARELAHDRPVAAIAVFTTSGRTARLMSKARPVVPILAFTPVEKTYDYLAMLWGTTPYLIPHADSLEEMLAHVDQAVVEGTRVQPGQEILLIAGFPIQKMVPPNFALLHTIEAH